MSISLFGKGTMLPKKWDVKSFPGEARDEGSNPEDEGGRGYGIDEHTTYGLHMLEVAREMGIEPKRDLRIKR